MTVVFLYTNFERKKMNFLYLSTSKDKTAEFASFFFGYLEIRNISILNYLQ